MKKTIISILILGGFVSGLTNCSDLKFGDGFLEKAPGGDVTVDTIFSSKLYADRALNSAYATLRAHDAQSQRERRVVRTPECR